MKRIWHHKGYTIKHKATRGFGVRYRISKGELFFGSAPSLTEARQIVDGLPV